MWPFGKKKVEVTVMSRENAVQCCREKHRQPSVIISISDPNRTYDTGPFCSKENGVTAILPLSFCDADGPGKDVYGRDVDESNLMQDEDAAKIARFVRENRDKLIIVHCDAGFSRSAGVGAAIAKYFTGDAKRYFGGVDYEPNMWCYSKTMMALLEA